MKRLTVFALMILALAAALLIGAGGTGSEPAKRPPYNPEPLAVVNKVWGNDTTIYFGELAYGSERYLMIVNSNCDSAVSKTKTETIHLIVCPGPGTYKVYKYVAFGDSLYEDSLTDNTELVGGELDTIDVILTRGGAALLHFDPVFPPDTSYQLSLNYHEATWDVNGRKIAVDTSGRVHVCYTDSISNQLSVWYARSDDACSTWQKQQLDSNALVSSMALDAFGVPFISYEKRTNGYERLLYLWSEGEYDTLKEIGQYEKPMGISSTIAIDADQGQGIVYYKPMGLLTGAEYFTPHSFPKYIVPGANDPGPPSIFSPSGFLSCTFGKEGDAIVGGFIHSLFDSVYLYRRVDRFATEGEMLSDYYSSLGAAGSPSLARQANDIWTVYCSNDTIKYKKASADADNPDNHYAFPEGSGTTITTTPGEEAEHVQIAEGMPFIVWEDHDADTIKIYYSYRGMGPLDTTWSTPQRVTSSGAGVYERYPHVAMDEKNDKIYIIWTQWGGGINTGIGIEGIDDDDFPGWDLFFTRPAGGETWYVKSAETINWHCDYPNVQSTRVYVKYSPSETFKGISSLLTGSPPDTMLEWVVGESDSGFYYGSSDSCQMLVKIWSGDTTAQDLIDTALSNYFTIRSKYVYIDPDMIAAVAKPVYEYGGEIGYFIILGDTIGVPWEGQNYHSFDTLILQFSQEGEEGFSPVAGGLPSDSTIIDTAYSGNDTFYLYSYSGSISWTVPTEPTSDGSLRIMAVDTTADTFYSNVVSPFKIPPPGGFQDNTYSNQGIISLDDAGRKIGLVYTAQDPDTADKLSVVYMESDEGLGFAAPDTVGLGCWPSFSGGACFWQNVHDTFFFHPDTLFYSYQTRDTFATPYPFMAISPNADSGGFAPVGLVSENDTVHAIIRKKAATHENIGGTDYAYYSLSILYTRFPETSPGGMASTMDTLQQEITTNPEGYNIGDYAPSVVKRDSVVYSTYNDVFDCCFTTITPSGKTTTTIGQGLQPSVSCSEGNITYTYLGSGDTSLVRLWRYLDDTTWVECDTFQLDDDAEVFCGEEGLMYGVQHQDTFLADLYVYDPISEEYYLTQEYTGYYPHTWLDDGASEFGWVTALADYVDSATTYMHTERHDMNVILPALYQEADDKRSPYTLYRDTCIHYTSVDVDSADDSLIYRFPHLNSSDDYAVIVEFYTECDSATQLQVTIGSSVDTIQIPGNSFSWYEQNIASSADTLNLAIRRISQFGFVPVSRLLVRRRSSEGFFMSAGGPQSAGPIKIPFCLYQPYPNPFADAATIRYSLPYATHVSLKVYDVSGRLVNKLVDGEVAPGVHTLQWRGKDDVNRHCASGVYFVRFTAGDYQASKKMVLIK